MIIEKNGYKIEIEYIYDNSYYLRIMGGKREEVIFLSIMDYREKDILKDVLISKLIDKRMLSQEKLEELIQAAIEEGRVE